MSNSVAFSGTYTVNGGQSVAAGTVAITPYQQSTTTATLDGSGHYSATLAFAGLFTIVETLTGAPVRTYTVRAIDGGQVDTGRDVGTVLGAGAGASFVTETVGGAHELDFAAGNKRRLLLTDDTVLSVANDGSVSTAVVVVETGVGGFGVTFWDGIDWGGDPPTITATANKRDAFALVRCAAGEWEGAIVWQGRDGPPAAPDAPTSAVATAGNAQASVAFVPGAANGSTVTGYTVTSSPGSHTGTGASSPIVVTGLTNGTAYTFTVHGTNGVGDSAESSPSSSVTPAAPTAPDAPTIGTSTAGDGTVTANWTAPASDGGSAITGYVVDLYLDADDSLVDTAIVGVTLTHTFTGVPNDIDYYNEVAAVNAIGTGAQTAASNTVTPAASFTSPLDIGSIVRWGDPDALAEADGVGVASYADASPAGTDLLQSTSGSRPIVKTGVSTGHKVLRFNGTSQFFRSASFGGSPWAQPRTYVIIIKPSLVDGTPYMVLDGNGGRQLIYLTTTWQMYAGASLVGPAATTDWAIIAAVFAGAESRFYLNGGAPSTGNPGGDNQGVYTLGASSASGNWFPGDMADDFAAATALSPGELDDLAGYFVAKHSSLGLAWAPAS